MKLRIMTFNVQGCKNYVSKKRDYNSIISLIEKYKPDIIGFNEVFGSVFGGKSQASMISKKLGYYNYFSSSTRIVLKKYGNAIISKYPIINNKTIKIPFPKVKQGNKLYEKRSILKSSLNIDDKVINIYITHLGLNEDEQKLGIETLNSLDFNNSILIGDFNIEPSNDLFKTLNGNLIDTDKYLNKTTNTFPSFFPNLKYDYIFVSKNIKILNSNTCKELISDHLAYIADIEI